MNEKAFDSLAGYLESVPAISSGVACGCEEVGDWWVKFSIDLKHHLAWHTVQELGHVLNYLSIDERLPTSFHPVSPPPYMNGGPEDYLSWVIECDDPEFKPDTCKKWLEGRLPRPVDDPSAWITE